MYRLKLDFGSGFSKTLSFRSIVAEYSSHGHIDTQFCFHAQSVIIHTPLYCKRKCQNRFLLAVDVERINIHELDFVLFTLPKLQNVN